MIFLLIGFEAAKNACVSILINDVLGMDVVNGEALKDIMFDGSHSIKDGVEVCLEWMALKVVLIA
jgi:hypothetical protein